jgi:hypothetical protein
MGLPSVLSSTLPDNEPPTSDIGRLKDETWPKEKLKMRQNKLNNKNDFMCQFRFCSVCCKQKMQRAQ